MDAYTRTKAISLIKVANNTAGRCFCRALPAPLEICWTYLLFLFYRSPPRVNCSPSRRSGESAEPGEVCRRRSRSHAWWTSLPVARGTPPKDLICHYSLMNHVTADVAVLTQHGVGQQPPTRYALCLPVASTISIEIQLSLDRSFPYPSFSRPQYLMPHA